MPERAEHEILTPPPSAEPYAGTPCLSPPLINLINRAGACLPAHLLVICVYVSLCTCHAGWGPLPEPVLVPKDG